MYCSFLQSYCQYKITSLLRIKTYPKGHGSWGDLTGLLRELVQAGSWLELAAEFQRIDSLSRAIIEPGPSVGEWPAAVISAAGAVALVAGAPRPGEMDPVLKGVSRSQQGRTHRSTSHLPSPSSSCLSASPAWMPPRMKGGRMGGEEDLMEWTFVQKGLY